MMIYNSHGQLRSVFLCQPIYYELCDFSEMSSQHIQSGLKISRKDVMKQYQEFSDVFEQLNIKIEWQVPKAGHPDQFATRDFGFNTISGVLVGKFRYPDNKGDEDLAYEDLRRLKIPIIGRINRGYLEGGDCWYLDERTMVIGAGNRTNLEGIQEAQVLLKPYGIEVIPVPFERKWNHLDMIFSVIAEKTVMLCQEALPEKFTSYLHKNHYRIITIKPEAVFQGTINLLALGKERVLSFKENKIGNEALGAMGLKVYDPPLEQFLMGGSGPHCLSFELQRDRN